MLSPENSCFHPCFWVIRTRLSNVPFTSTLLDADSVCTWRFHSFSLICFVPHSKFYQKISKLNLYIPAFVAWQHLVGKLLSDPISQQQIHIQGLPWCLSCAPLEHWISSPHRSRISIRHKGRYHIVMELAKEPKRAKKVNNLLPKKNWGSKLKEP